jgi:hypothetical protein
MPQLDKPHLLSNIRAIKGLPPSVMPIEKRDLLINLLLSYINDGDIIAMAWESGFDSSLSNSLMDTLKSKNPGRFR